MDVSSESPLGKAGSIDQDTTVPPVVDGVTEIIAVPRVSTKAFGL